MIDYARGPQFERKAVLGFVGALVDRQRSLRFRMWMV